MARRILGILLIFLPGLLFSQAAESDVEKESNKGFKESYRGSIGFGVGPAFPFGSFQDDEGNITEGGFAKTGLAFDLNFSYRFYKNLTANAQYARMNHAVDNINLIDSDFGFLCPCTQKIPKFNEAITTSYELNSLFLGIGFIKESKSLDFQMYFMGGFGTMYSPTVELIGDSDTLFLESKSQNALAYAVGAQLRIHLTETIDFNTSGTFVVFQDEFERKYRFNGVDFNSKSSLRHQSFNLTFGVAMRIIKEKHAAEPKLKY